MSKPTGKLAFAYATIARLEARIDELEADKGQGEPVHMCQKCNGLGSMPTRHAGEGENEYRNRCKLYAEQPAPVAVVMPEHRDSDLRSPTYGFARGWNACLDEFDRLNSATKP